MINISIVQFTCVSVSVATLVTDRHGQVRKWLRENKPRIEHLFDVWHIAKGKLASEWVSQPVSV